MNTIIETPDTIGEEHIGTSLETPLRKDAFEMDDALKIKLIQKHFAEIMHLLGLDLNDDNKQVVKQYIKILCALAEQYFLAICS